MTATGATTMMLNFPNASRIFDATRRAVRFWGHCSAMEVSFFMTETALKRVQPDMRADEVGFAYGDGIGLAAVHTHSAPGTYGGREVTIVTADFGVRR